MGKLKEIARNIPLLPFVHRALHNGYARIKFQSMTTEEVFTKIYRSNLWGGKHSASGTGSDVDQTKLILKTLSTLFDDFNISTMLDIPCGDFYWMKNADLSNIEYTGADIVKELIQKNTEKYGRGAYDSKI